MVVLANEVPNGKMLSNERGVHKSNRRLTAGPQRPRGRGDASRHDLPPFKPVLRPFTPQFRGSTAVGLAYGANESEHLRNKHLARVLDLPAAWAGDSMARPRYPTASPRCRSPWERIVLEIALLNVAAIGLTQLASRVHAAPRLDEAERAPTLAAAWWRVCCWVAGWGRRCISWRWRRCGDWNRSTTRQALEALPAVHRGHGSADAPDTSTGVWSSSSGSRCTSASRRCATGMRPSCASRS